MISESKSLIRKRLLELRDQLTMAAIQTRSIRIIEKIKAHPWYQEARIVGIYYPIGSEVNLLGLLQDHKEFCFPKIIDFSKTKMEFVRHTGVFHTGRFQLKEPPGKILPKQDIDLIFVPGVAFSRTGVRIGYGKGFFDQYLQDYSHKTIGIGYEFQRMDYCPSDPWDRPLDEIITDEEDLCIQP